METWLPKAIGICFHRQLVCERLICLTFPLDSQRQNSPGKPRFRIEDAAQFHRKILLHHYPAVRFEDNDGSVCDARHVRRQVAARMIRAAGDSHV